MNDRDPFVPLSRIKKISYAVAGAAVVVIAAILLGRMDDGFSTWQLLRVAAITGIPAFLMLAVVVWLTRGPRSNAGLGTEAVKIPVRILRMLPYAAGMIALFYLIKTLSALLAK